MRKSIQTLNDLVNRSERNIQLAFFARKGLAKALLWKSASTLGDEKISQLEEVEALLENMIPFSPYTQAHHNRLKARLAGLTGNIKTAIETLNETKLEFEKMRSGTESQVASLQSICCSSGISGDVGYTPGDSQSPHGVIANFQ